jgi:hypothetical protein
MPLLSKWIPRIVRIMENEASDGISKCSQQNANVKFLWACISLQNNIVVRVDVLERITGCSIARDEREHSIIHSPNSVQIMHQKQSVFKNLALWSDMKIGRKGAGRDVWVKKTRCNYWSRAHGSCVQVIEQSSFSIPGTARGRGEERRYTQTFRRCYNDLECSSYGVSSELSINIFEAID